MHFLSTSVLLCGFNMRPCNGASCIMIKTCNNFSLIYVQIVLEFTLQLSVFLTTGFNCELLKLMFELRCLKPDQFEGFFMDAWGLMHATLCQFSRSYCQGLEFKPFQSRGLWSLTWGSHFPPSPRPTIGLLWEMVEQVLLTGFRAFQPEADTWHG